MCTGLTSVARLFCSSGRDWKARAKLRSLSDLAASQITACEIVILSFRKEGAIVFELLSSVVTVVCHEHWCAWVQTQTQETNAAMQACRGRINSGCLHVSLWVPSVAFTIDPAAFVKARKRNSAKSLEIPENSLWNARECKHSASCANSLWKCKWFLGNLHLFPLKKNGQLP